MRRAQAAKIADRRGVNVLANQLFFWRLRSAAGFFFDSDHDPSILVVSGIVITRWRASRNRRSGVRVTERSHMSRIKTVFDQEPHDPSGSRAGQFPVRRIETALHFSRIAVALDANRVALVFLFLKPLNLIGKRSEHLEGIRSQLRTRGFEERGRLENDGDAFFGVRDLNRRFPGIRLDDITDRFLEFRMRIDEFSTELLRDGFLHGLVFGLVDVRDAKQHDEKSAEQRHHVRVGDEPIGFVLAIPTVERILLGDRVVRLRSGRLVVRFAFELEKSHRRLCCFPRCRIHAVYAFVWDDERVQALAHRNGIDLVFDMNHAFDDHASQGHFLARAFGQVLCDRDEY